MAYTIYTLKRAQCNILQHTATYCTILQHTHRFCSGTRRSQWGQTSKSCCATSLTATHCNILQHIATHCNTLQHTAIHCNTLQHTHRIRDSTGGGDRTENNYDYHNFKQVFTDSPEFLSFLGIPQKIQQIFTGVSGCLCHSKGWRGKLSNPEIQIFEV